MRASGWPRGNCRGKARRDFAVGDDVKMAVEPLPTLGARDDVASDVVRARWARLAEDFSRLPIVAQVGPRGLRDVGELLCRAGHDEALAEAERYVVLGHTIRTGHVVEFDDHDDDAALDRWTRELDRASADGFAPPVPDGFWASFLRWRTPMGMARLTDRRIRAVRAVV